MWTWYQLKFAIYCNFYSHEPISHKWHVWKLKVHPVCTSSLSICVFSKIQLSGCKIWKGYLFKIILSTIWHLGMSNCQPLEHLYDKLKDFKDISPGVFERRVPAPLCFWALSKILSCHGTNKVARDMFEGCCWMNLPAKMQKWNAG